MQPVRTITGMPLSLPQRDIDTDQIIPARFLTTTERTGLGAHAFANWRTNPDNPFDAPDIDTRQILVTGDNVGCGSSREHAVWALMDLGIKAVISASIADIFTSNAIRNGLLPVTVDAETRNRLLNVDEPITIDLDAQTVSSDTIGRARFEIDPFARRCLLDGTDETGFLLAHATQIEAFERSRQCVP